MTCHLHTCLQFMCYEQAVNHIKNMYNFNEMYMSKTPLMWTIGRPDYLSLLIIKKGCDLNLRDTYGASALIYSVYFSKKKIMIEILKRKPKMFYWSWHNYLNMYGTFFCFAIKLKQYSGLKYYYLMELKS